jgi:citronellol/citronellal dehydrogenase
VSTASGGHTGRSPLRPDANAGLAALISGGGTGIGRATALAFAAAGARVAICGRRPERLAETKSLIERGGGECHPIAADITEPDQAERVVAGVMDRFGAVDVLVNNAGGQFMAAAEEISDRGWRAVHRLAVDGAWSLTRRCAVRSMIPRRTGLIIFIGFSPPRGIPGFAHASAARAAVANLASGLSLEWSRFGIRSVCLEVGIIATDAIRGYGETAVSQWRQATPLRRLGEPEDVAFLASFVASPGGSFITGTTIAVDGGVSAWGQGFPPPPLANGEPAP